ncbi:hypothetical protein P153DRAFT_369612 [Dothidotthia symphoricarpi CBS 119687]|uniref:5'-3' DNA helicase ZGRF1-like N-terminal domain-containing protein n=1 Tax=Dothidotthia symphoricarpi CBS 119687 TaxID=1392245 RepID=A0A6A6A529_9PLEO|nr:uncharacterized protein P153DRAFT_369612 [Dothidotthia symphoricarpi CBS 119687]KAF2126275.1 hypothetical protein P153DRAFT_369612 [Dothidotthia symphoricarpi CBS 119687]
MTAPLRSTPHSSAVPASQNTAPVAEFRCLFTHDLRRKQKRWQDGYLKFHTFNNRVMVYDQTRYFLGDTYYKESNELHEGDELTLDKGIMVEVSEAMGVTQTDLTPLFENKTKDSPARPNATAPPRPFQPPSSVAPSKTVRSGSQLKHKSLNTLLGASKGPIGKSVPMESPYEARKEKEKANEWETERATKRQKTAQDSATSRVSSPPLDDSPVPRKNLPLWARTSDAKTARVSDKSIPHGATVITLDSSSDKFSAILSDVTLPCTSPGLVRTRPRSPVMPALPSVTQIVSEKPPVQTPRIPRGKVPVPHVKAMKTPQRPAPASSPPVSASNRLTNVDFAVQSAQKSPVQMPHAQQVPTDKPQTAHSLPSAPPRNPKAKSLRLSAGVKRGMLLCQSLPQQVQSAGSQSRVSVGKQKAESVLRIPNKDSSASASSRSSRSTAAGDALPRTKRKALTSSTGEVSKRARISESPADGSLDIFDDPEVVHGLLDQQLMVPSPPSEPWRSPSPPVSKTPKPKQTTTKKLAKKDTVVRKPPLMLADPEVAQARSLSPKGATRKTQPKKATVLKPQPARKVSPLAAPVLEAPQQPSREVSLARTDVSESTSRASSTSPRKLALSTGGFRKKPKRNEPHPTIVNPDLEVISAPRNESVALPPHPLRAGKKGPLMSTTELAALLQKSKKTSKGLTVGKEHSVVAGKSPNRTFRRVRSENDAPIPSTSEEWEKRNLPKPPADDAEGEGVQVEPKTKVGGLAALIKKTDPRKKLQRARSLTVDTNASVSEAESNLPSPVVDKDVGPWSTEAFDLFDWRPPKIGEGKT